MGLAAALALAIPGAAQAGKPDGKWQVKLLATGVLPDGKIDTVKTDLIGLPAGSDTKASDNWVPTLAVEYFFTPSLSAETICCLTEHHVNGAGPLAGARLVDHLIFLPATVTLKYHLPLGKAVKPYVGAGPSVFFALKDDVGADAAALGATKATVHDQFGFALQAGADIALNDKGLSLTLDAKRYIMRPSASLYAGSAEALRVRLKLDPWVVSTGVAYRF